MNTKLSIRSAMYTGDIEFHLHGWSGDHYIVADKPVEYRLLPEAEMPRDPLPLFQVSRDAAQDLLDQLWNMGFRPKDIGTAGHLAATQFHLNDMRKLVEKTLSVRL